MTKKHQKFACKLAAKLDVKTVDKSPNSQGFNWDGNQLAVKNSASNIIHDLSHWMVSPPKRRKLPEFGLGESPDVFSSASQLGSEAEIQTEEERASIFGILIERHRGMPWKKTWKYHCWHSSKEPEQLAIDTIEWLMLHGFVDLDLTPIIQKKRRKVKVSKQQLQKAVQLLSKKCSSRKLLAHATS